MKKRKITKLFSGIMAVGMFFSMPGMTNLVYAGTTSGEIAVDASNFPDATFRAYVSEQIDKDKNGTLSQAEMDAVKTIDVSQQYETKGNIASLKGVEYFTKITKLSCSYNKITSLDVSKNTVLTTLYCDYNQLTNLDLSKNAALTSLSCAGNRLCYVDLSNNTKIKINGPSFDGNQAILFYDENRKLDLSAFSTFDTAKLSNIQGATVSGSDLIVNEGSNKITYTYACGNNVYGKFTIYASQVGGKEIDINTANFPDENFRSYVGKYDYDGNSKLSMAELASAEYINVSKSNVKSLKGIEFFTGLTYLDCSGNQLTSLDVSSNVLLNDLLCGENQLTSIDVGSNVLLNTLSCGSNQLTSIDVSKNSELCHLECSNNQLTSLNLSKNDLYTLDCSGNPLTQLNVSGNTNLWLLSCNETYLAGLDLSTNTSLEELDCENQTTIRTIQLNEYHQAQLTGVDGSKVLNLQGGTIEGNTLTATAKQVTYTYNCGNGFTMNVALSCKATGYTVRFDGNGATGGVMSDMINCPFNGDTALTLNQYQKNGYTFAGWNSSADGTGTAFADGAKVNYGDDNYAIVLYAQWNKVEIQEPDIPVTAQWYEKDGKWFYQDATGALVTGWKEIDGTWYFFSQEGAMQTGWQEIGGTWYYFYSNGSMAENAWVDGCYLGSSGAWISNPVPEGWQKSGNRYWYQYADGTYAANTWKKIDGTWYYFDASGWMATGWTFDGSDWYYLNENGTMKTGWMKDGNTWYYLKSSGAMATGWVSDGGNWYLMDESGAMKTGWAKQGEDWYYMDESGIMKTGWLNDGGTWYYLQDSGVMAHDIVIDGYTLNADGVWIQ